MTRATRRWVLEETGLLHSRPEAVTAPLFDGRRPFFLALDKVQVKYEMLRAHAIDGLSATVAAERHGYSRAAFYLITTAFDQAGMRGLLDEPRGRRGPLKLTAEMMEFVASADPTLSAAGPLCGHSSGAPSVWCRRRRRAERRTHLSPRIDGSATTEMHRDRETECREEVRGEAQR